MPSPCPRDKNDKKGGNIEREREGRSSFFKSSIHLILLFQMKLKLKLDNRRSKFYRKKEKKKRKGEIPLRPMKSIEMLTHR